MAIKHLKGKIIIIVIVLLIFTIFGGITLYIQNIARNIIETGLNNELKKIDGKVVKYKSINVNLIKRSISINGIFFSNDPTGKMSADKEEYELFIKKAVISNINVWDILKHKTLSVNNVTVVEPEFVFHVGQKQTDKDKSAAGIIIKSLQLLSVDQVNVINGKVEVKNIINKLSFYSDSISITANKLSYKIGDTTINYNDSLYAFTLKNIKFRTPDGLYLLTIDRLSSKNAGEIVMSGFQYKCTVPKMKLSQIKGNVPTAWNDLSFKEIKTSKCNAIKIALSQKIDIDTIFAQADYIKVFKDNRYPEKRVKPMLQQSIMSIPIPINIKNVNVKIPSLIYQEIEKNTDVGYIELDYLNISMTNFNNQYGNTIPIFASGSVRNGGPLKLWLYLDLNKSCTFVCKASLGKTDGSAFNTFIVPIAGAEVKKCDIESVKLEFKGDSIETHGTFTMEYNNFAAVILKESPYTALSQNRGLINFAAKLIIPESNPKSPGEEPRSYYVSYKRNLFKPFGNYLAFTLIDGIMKTMIPNTYLANKNRIIQGAEEIGKLDKKRKEKEKEKEKGNLNRTLEELNKGIDKFNANMKKLEKKHDKSKKEK